MQDIYRINLYISLVCILFMAVLSFYSLGHHRRGKEIFFLAGQQFNLLSLAGNIVYSHFSILSSSPDSLGRYIGSSLMMVGYLLAQACFFAYFFNYFSIGENVKRWMKYLIIPLLACTGGLFLYNLFTQKVYSVAKMNPGGITEKSGALFLVLPLVIWTSLMVMFVRNIRKMRFQTAVGMGCFLLFPGIGLLIQFATGGLSYFIVFMSLSILAVFYNLEAKSYELYRKQMRDLSDTKIALTLSELQLGKINSTLEEIEEIIDTDPALAKQKTREFTRDLRSHIDELNRQLQTEGNQNGKV